MKTIVIFTSKETRECRGWTSAMVSLSLWSSDAFLAQGSTTVTRGLNQVIVFGGTETFTTPLNKWTVLSQDSSLHTICTRLLLFSVSFRFKHVRNLGKKGPFSLLCKLRSSKLKAQAQQWDCAQNTNTQTRACLVRVRVNDHFFAIYIVPVSF